MISKDILPETWIDQNSNKQEQKFHKEKGFPDMVFTLFKAFL